MTTLPPRARALAEQAGPHSPSASACCAVSTSPGCGSAAADHLSARATRARDRAWRFEGVFPTRRIDGQLYGHRREEQILPSGGAFSELVAVDISVLRTQHGYNLPHRRTAEQVARNAAATAAASARAAA